MTLGRCLVLGGAGFIGQAIVRTLRASGAEVVVFDRAAADVPGAIRGDLRDALAIDRAVEGADTVLQCAAELSFHPRKRDLLRAINVGGNRHVIAACLRHGARMVYTSTVDVLCDGHPLRDAPEHLPLPRRPLGDYAVTKALAERDVLAACARGLDAIILRPAGTWGPGDPSRLPPLVAAARAGRLVRLGDGRARFAHVYVDNVARAHVLAAQALARNRSLSGRVLHVTDFDTGNFFDFAARLLAPLGLGLRPGHLPERLAWALARTTELAWAAGGRLFAADPPLTRFGVAATCRDFTFATSAPEEIGYRPIVDLETGLERTAAWARARYQVAAG